LERDGETIGLFSIPLQRDSSKIIRDFRHRRCAAHKPAMTLELRVFDAWHFRQEQTAHRMTGRGPCGPLFLFRMVHQHIVFADP